MQQAAAFSLDTNPDSWWSYWHQHVDWAGRGNLRARHRHHYLLALALIFKRIASASHRIATPFQLFILLDGDDAGQDAVYLHSPNPQSDFPLVLSTSGAVQFGPGHTCRRSSQNSKSSLGSSRVMTSRETQVLLCSLVALGSFPIRSVEARGVQPSAVRRYGPSWMEWPIGADPKSIDWWEAQCAR